MNNQVKRLTYGVLAGLLSGGLAGCGATADITTTHPGSSLPIGPPPVAPPGHAAPGKGRPAAPGAASEAPTARVSVPAAAAAPVAAPAPVEPAAAPAPAPAVAPPVATALNMRTQSGRIIDEAGQPLVGATVLLRGTSQGASTDANGDYSLAVPLGVNTFVFGYSGYESEVAQSRDGQPLTVTLLPAEGQPLAASPEKEGKPHGRKKRR